MKWKDDHLFNAHAPGFLKSHTFVLLCVENFSDPPPKKKYQCIAGYKNE